MKFLLLLAIFTCRADFLLAQNGETDYPPASAHKMSVPLFNEKDFSGFTFCMKDNADPLKTWSVTNGGIHCTGTPTG